MLNKIGAMCKDMITNSNRNMPTTHAALYKILKQTNDSRPYPGDNTKHRIDVMFLTHPPITYDNVKCCSLHLKKVYMSLQHNVKGLLFKPIHPSITSILRFVLSLG